MGGGKERRETRWEQAMNGQAVPTIVTLSRVGQRVAKAKIMSAIESQHQMEIDKKRRERGASIMYVKGTK